MDDMRDNDMVWKKLLSYTWLVILSAVFIYALTLLPAGVYIAIFIIASIITAIAITAWAISKVNE